MRFSMTVAAACCVVCSLASCGGDNKDTKSTTTVDVNASTTTVDSSATSSSTPVVTDVFPTEPLPCQSVPVPATPVTSPAPSGSVLLTKVERKGDSCVDHVVFEFTSKGSDPPAYSITYGKPPFVQDGSGKPVTVSGSAFIVVKVSPGYGYDFETGTPTYTGPKRITPAANHVKEIVETGDFEGVLTWVIGLDSKRPFTVQATGKPQTQLVVTSRSDGTRSTAVEDDLAERRVGRDQVVGLRGCARAAGSRARRARPGRRRATGTTSRTNASVAAAFSSTSRARNMVPIRWSRLAMSPTTGSGGACSRDCADAHDDEP